MRNHACLESLLMRMMITTGVHIIVVDIKINATKPMMLMDQVKF